MTLENARKAKAADARQCYRVIGLNDFHNNRGTTHDHEKHLGRLNIWGNSLPREDLPPLGQEYLKDEVPFILSAEPVHGFDNVVCRGQSIPLPSAQVHALHVIGVAERRNVGHFVLSHEGRVTAALEIGFSDFWPEAPANFGNSLIVRMGCLHYPRHRQQNMHPSLWSARAEAGGVPADRLTLPDNPALHLFALTIDERRA